MSVLLQLCFLFFVGSCLGWCIELLFRRIFTAKKWINPGFLTGPYLPLYGFGLCFMYGVAYIPVYTGFVWADKLILILIAGVLMTALEYVAGLIFIKGLKIKLWDYSKRRGNIQGIICPLFSFIWTVVAAVYILFIHSFVTGWVSWFVNHLGFAFFVGLFFGVFFVDLAHSLDLSVKIRAFAKTNKIVVSYEKLKESIKDGIERGRARAEESIERGKERARKGRERRKRRRASFLFALRSGAGLQHALAEYLAAGRHSLEGSQTDGAEDCAKSGSDAQNSDCEKQ